MTAAIAVRGLAKAFGAPGDAPARALDGVSFQAERGALTAVVGPDGAGKTTLLRIAAGLLARDAGQVEVLGLDPAEHARALHARVGYMPQRFGLYEDLRVRENLALFADLRGVERAARGALFDDLLRMTGLAPFVERLAGKLSGGMKQKLGLACALLGSPEALLLDEPTVGVDPLSRRQLWEIVERLVAERGLCVLLATPYLDEAQRAAHVVVLDRGELLDQGPPARFAAALRGRVREVVPAPGEGVRRLQAELARAPGVIDATPRAGRVRVVLAPDAADAAAARGVAVEPVLEDAFLALLAGRRAPAPDVGAPAAPARARGGEPAVRVRDLVKRFGAFEAVRGVSFDVMPGEIFGLLGPNGAGKSTTFRMLCGLASITSGEATVAGRDLLRAGRKARAKLGYVAQRFSLYGALSVEENLRFFGVAYGLHGRRLAARIDELCLELGLSERRRETAASLPGGFQQRLAMAAALLHEPEILFLDEPTSGVDPLARREFWRRINALALAGTTVIVTTHVMEEAESCDRILIMARGEELALGTPDEIRALARTAERPEPSIEDAFIELAERRAAAGAGSGG